MKEHYPNDIKLKRYLIYQFDRSDAHPEQTAVRYAQEYQKAFPKRPESYKLLALAWQIRFGELQSQADQEKAIGYLRQFQKMVPPNSEHYAVAKSDISFLGFSLELFKKKGTLKP